MDQIAFVRDFVRESDPDRYFAALFAPPEKRGDLLALYAFDTEIRALRGKVREAMAGEIRIRWWQDQIAAPADVISGHPIADTLRAAIHRNHLPLGAFETYLEARIFDLYDDGFPTRGDLEAYCGETSGLIFQLGALMLDADAAPKTADACGHGACLDVVVRCLGAWEHPDRVRPLVPGDLLAAAGLERTSLGEPSHEHETETVRQAMIALAREHRAAFLDAAAKVPSGLKPIFLPLASALAGLDRIERGRGLPGRPVRQLRMLKVAVAGWPSR